MSSTIVNITFDCADPRALARFWGQATGWPVIEEPQPGYPDCAVALLLLGVPGAVRELGLGCRPHRSAPDPGHRRGWPATTDWARRSCSEDVTQTLDAGLPPDKRGWRVVSLSCENAAAAAHRLAGFGGQVEVLAPVPVRDRLVATAHGILGR